MSYKRFFGMIATSTVIMFGLMYATIYTLDDAWWSQTRFWMAVFMGSMMAIVMLSWMLNMYDNKKANVAIFVGSAVLFVAGLFFARSQTTVDDVSWMKAMIPHHSIAILTSERANISDPRVRRLADEIILAQRREIAEMEALIGDLERSDFDTEPVPPSVPPVTGGSDARTGPVPGAPALFADGARFVGDVLIVDSVKVASDSWVVVHPEAAEGGADVSRVVGRSFVQHGTTERVPVDLDAAPPGPLYVMLHDDSGEIGRFEFQGAGSPDQPIVRGGNPVAVEILVR
ncbi:DUF305 domain-containing protein [Rubrivirga sp. S365]|nr:DUF305 domain-containing protein [Rubrivirga sp. S365]MDT7856432.1 DUF305 domain-containing protein [Rubrivirga sp. S365]